ncbi:MAG: molybdopterin-binding protein [Myxococcota bacterium]|nr:molybdopterin-binding protein [Myxococcota bacterium]
MNRDPSNAAVLIGVISSSRSLDDDEGGMAVMGELEQAGLRVAARVEVGEEPHEIRRFIVAAQDRPDVQALVLVGGTGLSAMDHAFEVVRDFVDKEFPGFGESLRALMGSQFRSRVYWLRAAAGAVGILPIFCIPGHPAVCSAAASQLIAPELRAILEELQRERPPEEDIQKVVPLLVDEPENAFSEAEAEAEEDSESVAEVDEIPEGWQKRLSEMGGALNRGTHPRLPDWIEGLSAAREVLETSGERGSVTLPQGDYVALGFPDLRGARSRVLLLGQRSPRDEILALHRWPQQTGICAPRVGGVLPHRGRMGRTAEEVTGVDYPDDGRLFALASGLVYVLQESTVVSWDGKTIQSLGAEASALASLLLRWSQH